MKLVTQSTQDIKHWLHIVNYQLSPAEDIILTIRKLSEQNNLPNHYQDIVNALNKKLTHFNLNIVKEAIIALSKIATDDRVIDIIVNGLEHPMIQVLETSMQCIQRIAKSHIELFSMQKIDLIRQFLDSKNSATREAASEILVIISAINPAHIEINFFLEMNNSEKDIYRKTAVLVLGQVASKLPDKLDKEIVKALIKGLNDPEPNVGYYASMAFKQAVKYRPDLINLSDYLTSFIVISNILDISPYLIDQELVARLTEIFADTSTISSAKEAILKIFDKIILTKPGLIGQEQLTMLTYKQYYPGNICIISTIIKSVIQILTIHPELTEQYKLSEFTKWLIDNDQDVRDAALNLVILLRIENKFDINSLIIKPHLSTSSLYNPTAFVKMAILHPELVNQEGVNRIVHEIDINRWGIQVRMPNSSGMDMAETVAIYVQAIERITATRIDLIDFNMLTMLIERLRSSQWIRSEAVITDAYFITKSINNIIILNSNFFERTIINKLINIMSQHHSKVRQMISLSLTSIAKLRFYWVINDQAITKYLNDNFKGELLAKLHVDGKFIDASDDKVLKSIAIIHPSLMNQDSLKELLHCNVFYTQYTKEIVYLATAESFILKPEIFSLDEIRMLINDRSNYTPPPSTTRIIISQVFEKVIDMHPELLEIEIVTEITNFLIDSSFNVAQYVFKALLKISSVRPELFMIKNTRIITNFLKNQNSDIIESIIKTLVHISIGNPSYLNMGVFASILNSGNDSSKKTIGLLLKQLAVVQPEIFTQELVDAIIPLLNHPSEQIRQSSAYILENISEKYVQIVRPLEDLLTIYCDSTEFKIRILSAHTKPSITIVFRVAIVYDNPVLNDYKLVERTIKEGGIAGLNKLLDSGSTIIPKTSPCAVMAFTTAKLIEIEPIIKYLSIEVFHLPQNSWPEFLSNNYFKITTHAVANIISTLATIGTKDFITPLRNSAIFASKVFIYQQIADQQNNRIEPINSLTEFINECSFDMFAQTAFNILINSLSGLPLGYETIVTAIVGGLQCHHRHNPKQQESQSIIPYIADLTMLYYTTHDMSFDLSNSASQVETVTECIRVMSIMAMTDHLSKLTLATVEEFL